MNHKYGFNVVIVNATPSKQSEADNFAIQLTQDYGANGWQLASALPLAGGALLLIFQKELP